MPHKKKRFVYDWGPGKGRCPKGTYVRRHGKSKGSCTYDKKRANRIPCKLQKRFSKRCRAKPWM
jgi:hypothetical protein